MAEPLRLLVVEDSESDMRLLVRELERAGYELSWERVETAEAMRSALRARAWDLVISDYTLPTFSAPAALALLQESGLDLPFIIVSGSVGEDIAVEAMRAGAHDYLLKGNLKRLLPAIQRELRQADQRKARRAAEESNQKLLQAVEHANDAIFMTDPNGALTYVNPAFETTYGYSRQEALGKTPRILKSGKHDRAYYERFWHRLLAGEPIREEFVNKRKDGELVTMEVSVSPVSGSQGRRIGFIAVQNDITERTGVEEALRQSEERFRLAFSSSPVAMSLSERETGRMLDVNEGLARMLGYEREGMIGRSAIELGIWANTDERDRMIEQLPVHGLEVRLRTKSGETRYVLDSVEPLRLGEKQILLSVLQDITDHKLAEEGMRRSEERFRRLFDSNTIGITVADLSGQILESNDAYLDMIGYTREELLSGGVRWDKMTPAEYRERDQIAVGQLQRMGVAQPYEKELIRKDGTRVPLLIGIAMLEASEGSIIAYTVDLSVQRQLEQQLRQAQKIEAVGQLAGGIAHDFNNLLTVILGYAELLARRADIQEAAREEIAEIRKAGERAATLTRQLLAFSRRQVLEPVVLGVNELIGELEKMLRRLIGEDVELVTLLDPSVSNVRADPGQLEQVIVNLVVNARDAMPQGGRLTIETADAELDEAYALGHVSLLPGHYTMVAVSDTGAGIDAATQARIFEPFFTTKERGTGLGLSTVYGIVKQSSGYIWVYSEPGRGATFKVYLPSVAEAPAVREERAGAADTPGGSETILLVEDEQLVRTLSRRILEAGGYRVLEASKGAEALELVRGTADPIHLILTDLVMPEMSGSELASLLLALRPTVRVLYMSGYTDDGGIRSGLLEHGWAFVQKPFTPAVLLRKVRRVLDS